MTSKFFWFFLVVSILANLGFAGGYVDASIDQKRATHPSGAEQLLVARLGLTGEQLSALRRHRQAAWQAAESLDATAHADQEAFWSALVAGDADQDVIRSAIEAEAARRAWFTRQVTAEMQAFVKLLSPDQRREFRLLVSGRPLFQGRFLMGGVVNAPRPAS